MVRQSTKVEPVFAGQTVLSVKDFSGGEPPAVGEMARACLSLGWKVVFSLLRVNKHFKLVGSTVELFSFGKKRVAIKNLTREDWHIPACLGAFGAAQGILNHAN